tara:strand:+ start:2082 stop:4028 length:1947 start_codon:yes stop_codon:yes gene_type:complete
MNYSTKVLFLVLSLFSFQLKADNFLTNTTNNHGMVGLINMPTARIYDEGSFAFSAYGGSPDQKITLASSPFDWLEASVFYTNIKDKPYCEADDYFCSQDYKDKGFNLKIKIKEEDRLPAIAIGINDFGGTGLYGSEYIVGSYGIENMDFHFGLGWGAYNGTKDFRNPFTILDNQFKERPLYSQGEGGELEFSKYFSNEDVSAFFGISYLHNNKMLFKLERDTTLTPGLIGYEKSSIPISFGINYLHSKNLTFGMSFERNNYFSLNFTFKRDAAKYVSFEYTEPEEIETKNRTERFISNLNANNIGVNKIIEKGNAIGVEITQFTHPSIEIIEEIIMTARNESGLKKEIIPNYTVANLDVEKNFGNEFEENSVTLYERKKKTGFTTDTRLNFRPFLAAREGFFRASLLLENDSEYVFTDNLFVTSNLKYSIYDNFDDLTIPPETTEPAQVRSDVKDYLRNLNDGIVIGRLQADYFHTPSKNNHIVVTAGILEEMFSGLGMEYLHYENDKNYAYGFEIFHVQKRGYDLLFDTLDYKNVTGHFNFYYRNYGSIPFDAKFSLGEYLAGDKGFTLDLSRTYKNGVKFGVFATFTDVSREDFGEGSFDKGVYFNIPIYRNLVNYTWRPLTKDPGAKLNRKNSLYDLLIRFNENN